jgi:hypothetical protein
VDVLNTTVVIAASDLITRWIGIWFVLNRSLGARYSEKALAKAHCEACNTTDSIDSLYADKNATVKVVGVGASTLQGASTVLP